MGKNKKSVIFFWILTFVTLLYIGFIWVHSTMSAADSSAESATVLTVLEYFFKFVFLKFIWYFNRILACKASFTKTFHV